MKRLLQRIRRQFVALIVFWLFDQVMMVSCRGLLLRLYFTTATAPEEVVLHFSHRRIVADLLLLVLLLLLLLLLLLVLAVFEIGQRMLLDRRLWPEKILSRVRCGFGLVRILHVLRVYGTAQSWVVGRKDEPVREPGC